MSKQLLAELKQILETELGIRLTDKAVLEFASTLVPYYDLLAEMDFNNRKKHDKNK